ncbi:MAG TPA: twin-arginine translocase TatA/TatE family subunit [Vicinamibacteria bacterium]|jgi:TatA/E family protein of Tat protein translocase
MFGPLGGPELLLILVLALIVFGPRKLPEIGRSMGRMMAEFRKASNEFRRTLEDEVEAEKAPPPPPAVDAPPPAPPAEAAPGPEEAAPPAGVPGEATVAEAPPAAVPGEATVTEAPADAIPRSDPR